MEPSYRLRLYLLTALILVGFGALLTRLHEFQIERRDEFLQLVPGNRNVTVREPGIRGEITDRNGIPLAKNLRSYEATFNLDEIRQNYLAQHENDPTIDRITRENGMMRRRTEKDIVSIVKEGPIAVMNREDLKLARDIKGGLRVHYLTHGGLIPFPYRSDLTYDEFAKFAEYNLELPGVYLGLRPARQYPYGSLASHVLGYMRQWEKDIPEGAARKFDHYVGDEKGIAGVEATMDSHLRGLEGQKTIVKDEKGRTIRMADYTKPGVGARVELAIDAPLQYLLENTLRMAGTAAGVIMDVNTGEVLAMASVPDFDPNDYTPSISAEKMREYDDNKLAPMVNGAINSFVPGSTMKIPTAIAGAVNGLATRRFNCNGTVSYGKTKIGCWIWNQSKGSHGSQNLSQAIQHSCNPYFNLLAGTLGWQRMVEGCQLVSIGKRTGIELPSESAGSLPGSRAWRQAFPKLQMTSHETAQLSIGQGTSMATPLQMCAVAATVANGGKYYRPRVVKKVVADNGNGDVIIGDLPILEVDLLKSGAKASDIQLIREGMRMSVNERGGTSGKVKMDDVVIAAKSGTAQAPFFGKKSNNSWIISFAPYDKPKYAMCIMVRNAGSGGGVAGPLTNLIYRGIFARDNKGIRLPLKPMEKSVGNMNRIEKVLEVPPEMIAAVEAGDTSPTPEAIAAATAAATPDPSVPVEEVAGETGDEVGDVQTAQPDVPSTDEVPTPTITPEVDPDGAVIPRATPVEGR